MTLASSGYVVVAPNYISLRAFGDPTGFLHPYLVGQPTAIASLDAVRAAAKHATKQEGVPPRRAGKAHTATHGLPFCASKNTHQ